MKEEAHMRDQFMVHIMSVTYSLVHGLAIQYHHLSSIHLAGIALHTIVYIYIIHCYIYAPLIFTFIIIFLSKVL